MVYRIYTENKNKADVVKLVSEQFEGFTVIEAEGYWRGQPEASLIIEIVGATPRLANEQDSIISALAQRIRDHNKQETVLVTRTAEEHWFI